MSFPLLLLAAILSSQLRLLLASAV